MCPVVFGAHRPSASGLRGCMCVRVNCVQMHICVCLHALFYVHTCVRAVYMCMYICHTSVFRCVCAHVFMCMCVCMNLHTRVCRYVHTYVYIRVHTFVFMSPCVRVCVPVFVIVSVHVCMCVHNPVCAHEHSVQVAGLCSTELCSCSPHAPYPWSSSWM